MGKSGGVEIERRNDAWLNAVSLLYLLVPHLVFFWGWLRPAYAGVATAVVLAALVGLGRRALVAGPPDWRRLRGHGRPLVGAGLILLLWLCLSGVGGVGAQNSDYLASNALLKDLIIEDLPLRLLLPYVDVAAPVDVVYYVAYYLPAVFAGKVAGWSAANVVLFLWTAVGLVLVLVVLVRMTGVPEMLSWAWLAALMLVMMGGLDAVGWWSWKGELPWFGQHLEWWNPHLQYPGATALLFWVPQQAVAGWLMTGLTMSNAVHRAPARTLLLCWAAGLLWSPFAALGMVPFVALAAVQTVAAGQVRSLISVANLVTAPVVAGVTALYLSASRFSFPHGWVWRLWPEMRWSELADLWLFEVLCFVPFVLLALRSRPRRARLWGWVALAGLLLIPLYGMGGFNDLCMRASIPALMVLWVWVIVAAIDELRRPGWRLAALGFVLALGSYSSLSEIWWSVSNYRIQVPRFEEVGSLTSGRERDQNQRAGDRDAFFFRYLARGYRAAPQHPTQ